MAKQIVITREELEAEFLEAQEMIRLFQDYSDSEFKEYLKGQALAINSLIVKYFIMPSHLG